MKKVQSITETLAKGKGLIREKETESNWNKIDQVLERVSEIKKKEEAREILGILPLVCMGIQSNRSKLSGTGCKALSSIFEVLGNEMKEHLPQIFPCLLNALGKANKVIFMRALSTAVTISRTCTVKSISRHIRLNITNHSKTIRQGMLEMAIGGIEKERIKDLADVLEILKEDVNPEIRGRAREGLARISEMDRKAIIDLASAPIAKEAPETKDKDKEETKEAPKTKDEVSDISPSILSNICETPNKSAIMIKDSGASVIIRGGSRSFMYNSPEVKSTLRPGYSLERIGHRLEMHKKEIEEGMKKEWTPRKIPIIKKRQRQSCSTPISISKSIKYTEENIIAEPENESLNLSEEIGNLSITKTEDTDHIVENKEMYDSIFSSKEAKGTKDFLDTCEVLADEPISDTEYSVLAPDVLIRRATTKKI